jgi:2-keto-4-pentenoate hydratase/2-oxohepta-3-ene-1,7-dioic acid hydratase in catechol pathway
MIWSLVSMTRRDGDRAVGALRPDGTIAQVAALAGFTSVLDVVRRWDAISVPLRGYSPADAPAVGGGWEIDVPLRYPAKVLCSGPNFTDHLREMGEPDLGTGWRPFFFLKPPTTTVVGPGAVVCIDDESARADWEGELAVVIGRGGRRISPSNALGHVAGYTIANDISLRAPHHRASAPAPFVWDWLASKGADGSLPLGPGITPAWLIPDPQQLRIRTTVNGTVMQDGTTADMVFGVAELVAAASALTTLEPGDVIATGTPAGVGAGRGAHLRSGDRVEVRIDGLGLLVTDIALRTDQPCPPGSHDA